jgi:hypothetical protein
VRRGILSGAGREALQRVFPSHSSCRELARAPPIEEALVSGVDVSAHAGAPGSKTFPKIELHVHLEGTVRARTLLQIAKRNGVPLPADSVEGLAGLYEYRDFTTSYRCGC